MDLAIYVYVGMQVGVSTLLRGLLVLHNQTLSRCIIHTACTALPTCVTRTLCLSVLCVSLCLSITVYCNLFIATSRLHICSNLLGCGVSGRQL